MPAPASPYDRLPDFIAALLRRELDADVRHARRPYVLGPDAAALRYHAQRYEATACLNEANPAVALALVPHRVGTASLGPGLPLVPSGLDWRVDKPGAPAKSVTLTLLVSGAVSLEVTAPSGATVLADVTPFPDYSTAVFSAAGDGLYRVRITAGTVVLRDLFVPVQRAEFRRFREHSRAQDFLFRSTPPKPDATYCRLLALLYAKEAAARTGQTEAFATLSTAAAAVPAAPTPIHRYPHV